MPALAEIRMTLLQGAKLLLGWILFLIQNPGPDPLTVSLARLRTVLWGAHPWTPGEAEVLLNQAGYIQVETMPSGSTAAGVRILGRRSLEEAG